MGETLPDGSAISRVRAFCDAWTRLDMDAVVQMLHPGIDYHNIPMKPLTGKPAVEAYLRSVRFESCAWDLRWIAATGMTVLTERVDRLVLAGHDIVLPVMGTFEIEDDLIRRWRDYFDLTSYKTQWPQQTARIKPS